MDEATATLVRAARQAFAQHGVERTTMTDVARAAGVVRQTVYNTVSGREQLIELAMIQCCEDLQEQIDAFELDADDPSEALVEFLARAVEIAGNDPELSRLSAALTPEQVQAVFGGSYPVQALITQSLHPLLERGVRAGLLRDGVSVDEAGRWLQGVLTFSLRDADDPTTLRRELRTFALPSVFRV
ncbi:TetR/AcrR family transcriptional regulator [Aeromicrobium sp. Root495]|uniref:TetR/AcrR family transcriptional regulator n=1 Tax=Aeromicrobium sp. Root495 TaxID=1736550 RepID=UPI0012E79747|nr:TetR family transcriptional regulator [Aeromicrobium sp. Root495]